MYHLVRNSSRLLSLFQVCSTLFLTAQAIASEGNFPSPDAPPHLQYQPLTSVFPDPMVLLTVQDLQGALEVLRGVSSATPEFQSDLLSVVQNAKALDSAHLGLIADGTYFTWLNHEKMILLLSDPHSCAKLSYSACQAMLSQTRSNVKLAEQLGQGLNQLLATGLTRMSVLNSEDGVMLLQKATSAINSEVTEALFKQALKLVPPLSADQKLQWLKLAQEKMAFAAAKKLAVSWFKKNSDLESATLIEFLNSLTSPELRDAVYFDVASSVQQLTSSEAKALILSAKDSIKTALVCMGKRSRLSPEEVTDIASLMSEPKDRDQWLAAAVRKLGSLSGGEALAIARIGNTVSPQIAGMMLGMIPRLNGTELYKITKSVASGPNRDQLILEQVQRLPSPLTALEARFLVSQADRKGLEVALLALTKIEHLDASSLVQIVDALRYGPDRDQALLAGAKRIDRGVDVESVKIAIREAYHEKIQVLNLLVKKLPSFSTVDLASLAMDVSSGSLKDHLLLSGSKLVTEIVISGLIAMINQSEGKKFLIAYSMLSQVNQLSARDFGIVLKVIADGAVRDQLISVVLPMVKKVDGLGAATIVESCMERKVQVAMNLVRMIPKIRGTDLEQILGACSSGVIRDQILDQAIPLLNSLTKEEAKTLQRRTYNNKDSVALLLMSKVDSFDGTTIAEIASLSAKATSRDLIITEGLKRLKEVDASGLIAMIKTADKLAEKLALEIVERVPHYSVGTALTIFDALPDQVLKDSVVTLKDGFLVRSVELIEAIDEPAITLLALTASNQKTRDAIIQKGVERLGGPE